MDQAMPSAVHHTPMMMYKQTRTQVRFGNQFQILGRRGGSKIALHNVTIVSTPRLEPCIQHMTNSNPTGRKLARRLEDLEKRASWEASDSYEHAKRTLVGGNGQDVAKTAATSLIQIIDTDTRSGSSSSHPFAMKCLRAMGIYLAKSSSKSLSQENFLKVVHSRSSDSRFVFGRVIQWAEKWLELSIQVDVTDETSIEEANPVDGERSTDEHREQLPDTSAESSSPGSSRGSDQKNASKTSKRKTTERGSVDEDDSEADPDSHNPKKTKADSKSNLRFACPYFKKNPSKHIGERTCVGPGWSSVRRVK